MQRDDARSEARGRSDSPSMDAIVKTLADHLEAERVRVVDEIRTYPSPIPACDAQFNHLLGQRTKLSQELERLRQIHNDFLPGESGMKRLRAFIASAECIHPDTRHQMMKACGGHVSKQRE